MYTISFDCQVIIQKNMDQKSWDRGSSDQNCKNDDDLKKLSICIIDSILANSQTSYQWQVLVLVILETLVEVSSVSFMLWLVFSLFKLAIISVTRIFDEPIHWLVELCGIAPITLPYIICCIFKESQKCQNWSDRLSVVMGHLGWFSLFFIPLSPTIFVTWASVLAILHLPLQFSWARRASLLQNDTHDVVFLNAIKLGCVPILSQTTRLSNSDYDVLDACTDPRLLEEMFRLIPEHEWYFPNRIPLLKKFLQLAGDCQTFNVLPYLPPTVPYEQNLLISVYKQKCKLYVLKIQHVLTSYLNRDVSRLIAHYL